MTRRLAARWTEAAPAASLDGPAGAPSEIMPGIRLATLFLCTALTTPVSGQEMERARPKTVASQPDSAWRLAQVFLDAGQVDSALVYFRATLGLVRLAGDARAETVVLRAIASTYHRASHPPDLRAALAYYDSAGAARSASVASFGPPDTAKARFSEEEVDIFEEWALAWLASSVSDTGSAAALGALGIAERARGHRLLSTRLPGEALIHALELGGSDPADDARSLLFWTMGLRDHIAGTLAYLVTSDTLLAWLALPSGETRIARQPIGRDSIVARVAALRLGLSIDGGARSPVFSSLEPAGDWRGFGDAPGTSGVWSVAARRLAEVLLPPELLSRLPAEGELVILPDRVLGFVPFAVLPLSRDQTLAERYAIRYAPSLTALKWVERGEVMPVVNFAAAAQDTGVISFGGKAMVQAQVKKRQAWLAHALVVGNPTMPRVRVSNGVSQALTALPGAEAEALSVSTALGVSSLRGPRATEADVRLRMPKATVIHFATHGFAFNTAERVGDSFVALAPTARDDGLLTVREILDEVPALTADLVVLSACQTALGRLQAGEGTIGLQFALLAKGARSVLVSLWNVSDVATRRLMERFYHHWLGGASKAEALRKAQRDIAGDKSHPEWANPRYWAAFQLVGAQ